MLELENKFRLLKLTSVSILICSVSLKIKKKEEKKLNKKEIVFVLTAFFLLLPNRLKKKSVHLNICKFKMNVI